MEPRPDPPEDTPAATLCAPKPAATSEGARWLPTDSKIDGTACVYSVSQSSSVAPTEGAPAAVARNTFSRAEAHDGTSSGRFSNTKKTGRDEGALRHACP